MKTSVRWLLFEYKGLELVILSKTVQKTKSLAEKARLKYPDRVRRKIGIGVVRVPSVRLTPPFDSGFRWRRTGKCKTVLQRNRWRGVLPIGPVGWPRRDTVRDAVLEYPIGGALPSSRKQKQILDCSTEKFQARSKPHVATQATRTTAQTIINELTALSPALILRVISMLSARLLVLSVHDDGLRCVLVA